MTTTPCMPSPSPRIRCFASMHLCIPPPPHSILPQPQPRFPSPSPYTCTLHHFPHAAQVLLPPACRTVVASVANARSFSAFHCPCCCIVLDQPAFQRIMSQRIQFDKEELLFLYRPDYPKPSSMRAIDECVVISAAGLPPVAHSPKTALAQVWLYSMFQPCLCCCLLPSSGPRRCCGSSRWGLGPRARTARRCSGAGLFSEFRQVRAWPHAAS
jgi:hypothetical protein